MKLPSAEMLERYLEHGPVVLVPKDHGRVDLELVRRETTQEALYFGQCWRMVYDTTKVKVEPTPGRFVSWLSRMCADKVYDGPTGKENECSQ